MAYAVAKCYGIAIAMSWRVAMSFCDGKPCQCHGPSWCAIAHSIGWHAMECHYPWHFHGIVMAMPWPSMTCRGNAIVVHGNAMKKTNNVVLDPTVHIGCVYIVTLSCHNQLMSSNSGLFNAPYRPTDYPMYRTQIHYTCNIPHGLYNIRPKAMNATAPLHFAEHIVSKTKQLITNSRH